MTAILSPIDGVPMRKLLRYGVEIDVCTRTGGVWLDKGELEKIVHIVRDDRDTQAEGVGQRHALYEDEDDPPTSRNRPDRHKRSRLLDIFDF
jgi:Zn-finger nucleic acid-binding protein